MTTLRRPHQCPLYEPDRTGIIERCDECGTLWRSVVPVNPDYVCWYRVGPLRRWAYRRRGIL